MSRQLGILPRVAASMSELRILRSGFPAFAISDDVIDSAVVKSMDLVPAQFALVRSIVELLAE